MVRCRKQTAIVAGGMGKVSELWTRVSNSIETCPRGATVIPGLPGWAAEEQVRAAWFNSKEGKEWTVPPEGNHVQEDQTKLCFPGQRIKHCKINSPGGLWDRAGNTGFPGSKSDQEKYHLFLWMVKCQCACVC